MHPKSTNFDHFGFVNQASRMKVFLITALLLGVSEAKVVASIDDTCPLPDRSGMSSFVLNAESPLGEIPTILINFDHKRGLPFSSTAFHDDLNTEKSLQRADAAEPFGPVQEECASLSVPKTQFNCTGGIGMTQEQMKKAAPRYTWDRGHLTPANPMRFSKDALAKTFSCVNLAPQDAWTNQNPWKDIELFTEKRMKKTKGFVMTGLCSANNVVDGPTTRKGYTIPQCFWKLACYKDPATKETKVVGYIGENTIVNFKDKEAQGERHTSTVTPHPQEDVLSVVDNPKLIEAGWKDAEKFLLPGREVTKSEIPTAKECINAKAISEATIKEWSL